MPAIARRCRPDARTAGRGRRRGPPGAWPSSTPRRRRRRAGAGRRRAGARVVRRRARPARPVPRRLGDQVRAGPPGRAVPGLGLDAPVDATCRSCRATGGVPVRDVAGMTSGVDWVEDHRDPAGPATALVGAFATGGSSRALLTRVGARYPPGTRYAYCTADSQVLDWVRERATGVAFPDALAAAVAGPGVHRGRRGRRRRRRGGAGRRRRGRRGRRLGPGRACSSSTGPRRAARLLDRRGSRPPRARRCRSCAPAGCPRRCRRTSGSATTGGPWTRPVISAARALPPTAAAASSSTSTGRAARSW